jgi:hypothetical protein
MIFDLLRETKAELRVTKDHMNYSEYIIFAARSHLEHGTPKQGGRAAKAKVQV